MMRGHILLGKCPMPLQQYRHTDTPPGHSLKSLDIPHHKAQQSEGCTLLRLVLLCGSGVGKTCALHAGPAVVGLTTATCHSTVLHHMGCLTSYAQCASTEHMQISSSLNPGSLVRFACLGCLCMMTESLSSSALSALGFVADLEQVLAGDTPLSSNTFAALDQRILKRLRTMTADVKRIQPAVLCAACCRER